MTINIVNGSQYKPNGEVGPDEFGIFTFTTASVLPVTKEAAYERFKKEHAKSDYGKAGWLLIGQPTIMTLRPDFVEKYKDCLDNGADDEMSLVPANTVSHLRLVTSTS